MLDADGSGRVERGEFVRWWDSSQLQDPSSGVGTTMNKIAKAGKSRVLAAKRDRKRAEEDVNLLMNRLKHLQMEEAKARKKIDETVQRANEIIVLKARNTEKRALGQTSHAQTEETRQMNSAKNQKAAADGKMRRIQARENQLSQKKQAVEYMTAMRNSNQSAIRQQKNAFVTANTALRDQIKTQEQEKRAMKQFEEERRKKFLADKQENRVKEENIRQAQAERVIASMEQEEERLIEKLRATQDKQRAAYEKLEHALQS